MRNARRGRTTALGLLEVRVAPELADLVGALLVEEGSGGAVHDERPHEVRLTCYGDPSSLGQLMRRMRRRLSTLGVSAAIRVGRAPRAVADWQTAWTRDLAVVRISSTLSIVPTTVKKAAGGEGVYVLLEPAMAFGFGEHATTRMAALEVEARCRAGARRLLDVGTGSGVLAIVAALTGALRAVGTDVDPVAVAAARANAERNGVAGKCRFSRARLGQLRATFDTVVANVDRATLLELSSALVDRVEPGGVVLLTGLLREDARDVSRRYRELGLTTAGRREEDGWVLLRFRRRRAAP